MTHLRWLAGPSWDPEGELDPRFVTTPRPKFLDRRQVRDVLDQSHQDSFLRAIKNILATSIAEQTYAQLLDGMPLRSVAFGDTYHGRTIHDPVYQHVKLCDGVLERLKSFRDEFDPLALLLDVKTLLRYQNHPSGSKRSELPFIELVVAAIHSVAVALFEMDVSLHKNDPLMVHHTVKDLTHWGDASDSSDTDESDTSDQEDEHVHSITDINPLPNRPSSPVMVPEDVPIPEGMYEVMLRRLFLCRHLRRRLYCHFSIQHYECVEQYPHGVADITGYWAEDQIFGGVVLFERGENPIKTPYAKDRVWYHSHRDKVTSRPYALTKRQKSDFYNFLVADPNDLPPCPFPILADDRNWIRVDKELAIPKHNIYRDRWERRIESKNEASALRRRGTFLSIDYPLRPKYPDVSHLRRPT